VTVARALAVSLIIAGAGTVASLPGSAESPAEPTARLKAIRTRSQASGTSLVIEATEPVPYTATRPDSQTLLLDFRNVGFEGVANSARTGPGTPIADVSVERVETLGAPVARVRVALSQTVKHQVRSERNIVFVDLERTAPQSPGPGAAAQANLPDAMLALRQNEPPAQPAAPAQAPAAVQAPAGAVASLTAQQPATPTPADQIARGGRQYTGNPVTLDFQQADLRLVLRAFNEISGLNIVIDPAVQGSVDVALKDVPWDQALDIILRANKLGYIVDGTIVRIAPLAVLADEEAQRRKLAEEQALAGQLQVVTRTLSYARAEDLQALLTRSVLSQRGTVQVDPRTNTLIITDLQERLTTAAELIGTLDTPQPQVEIEARIVQTNKNFARELGVQWGISGRVDPSLGNTTNLAFPNSGSVTGRVGPVQGPGQTPTGTNLGVANATSAVGLALGSVNGAFNLDVALSALEQSGNGRILSTPRVSTLNNVEAEVTQGVQIPLQTIANNTVTVTFKDAALSLRVTPQITAADTVIMRISLENATPDFSRAAGPAAIPPIDTQRAITTLLVNDGQTTVIGGIYTSNLQNLTNRTPGLGQIPLLSWLFRRDRVSDESRELLIFITPRIIRG
jgi:type IV pilus assembly protein PilQ